MNSRRTRFLQGFVILGAAALVYCAARPVLHAEEPAKPTAIPRAVDRAAFDSAISNLRGKVVLVDFWATWCLPCIAQLPHTVDMDSRFRDRGLAVVTLSMDDADALEQVRNVLQAKSAAPLTNLISSSGGSPQSMEAFEIAGGALPHYKLYDRSGKLRHTFSLDPAAEKQFTPADIEAAVAKLLAE